MTTIVAVRHGETTWNREQLLQGWAPAPLTDLGREQGGQLGAVLSERYDIDRILSSDLHRTEETVEILREHVDAPVSFESAWRERVIERWETTLAESESNETILVVTHGGPIRLLLGHLKDLDIVDTIMEQSQGNCSINEFEFDHGTGAVRIVCENDTSHC